MPEYWLAIAIATIVPSLSVLIYRLAVTWLSLRGTKPEERPKILEAMADVMTPPHGLREILSPGRAKPGLGDAQPPSGEDRGAAA
jgi:hypothetical protein